MHSYDASATITHIHGPGTEKYSWL